ncbi:MAG TPA: zinc ribbon domain-containing protein, partial [Candidatus Binatia bacterium]|nr:zinc ribbon domain-containing protein [Candidatus Binatia bacterium]
MSSAQCPQCAGPVGGSDRFCTSCGSALSWDEQITEATGGPTFVCPECREPNPASRLLCQRCGALLEPAQAPLPASLAPGGSWRWRAP